MAAVSCFPVRFSNKRSLPSWDTDRLHHYNHELYPLEFLATDFEHRWQKYCIEFYNFVKSKNDWVQIKIDWLISFRVIDQNQIRHLIKSLRFGQTYRPGNKTQLSSILSGWTDIINSFAIFASVKLLNLLKIDIKLVCSQPITMK